VEAAKALGGSFKLVTLMPKTVREMTQLPRETFWFWHTRTVLEPGNWPLNEFNDNSILINVVILVWNWS